MALETPSWLNVDFMEKILRKSENDNTVEVIDVYSKPATAKGDNYTSDMIRVIIEFMRKQDSRQLSEKKSIILKLAPMEEGVRKDLVEKTGVFETEVTMMTNTLTKMNELLEPEHALGARVFYTQFGNPTLLAIEDLRPHGFRMADRHTGLDLAHSLLAIRGLARFHASSIAVCEQDPKQRLLYTRCMLSKDHPAEMGTFFTQGTKTLGQEVANWPELGSKYADKIIKLSENIYTKGAEVVKCREEEFNVINHGDSWVNNMLFRYDDNGKPIGHIFVDFQLCFYGSPAIDLLYFLSTSPSNDVFETSKHVLLEEYLHVLSATMKQLGCKRSPLAMDELKKMMRDKALYGMIAAFTVLPVVLSSKGEAPSLEDLVTTDEAKPNYSNKTEAYRKIMIHRIPQYDDMGLLDW